MGVIFIYFYNDYNVIVGQVICVKELLEDVEGLDILIVFVGGGGFMSGIVLSVWYFVLGVKVYGVEFEVVDDVYCFF